MDGLFTYLANAGLVIFLLFIFAVVMHFARAAAKKNDEAPPIGSIQEKEILTHEVSRREEE